MFRTIIVPLDGSPFAEHALPYAFSIARAMGAAVHLVHVHVSLALEAVPYGEVETHWDMKIRSRELGYLDEVLERVRSTSDVEASVQLLEGSVATALLDFARDHESVLVVMATHGRGGVNRAWLGSVADDVVRRSHLPVLLIRPTEEEGVDLTARPRIGHMLIPLDGSKLAEQVIQPATALGDALGARYTLLRVVPMPFVPGTPYVPLMLDQDRLAREEREAEAEEYLEQLAHRLRESGMNVQTRAVTGEPARMILDQAEELGADAIAVATHGRGAALRMILGSVADKVVRGAATPVLVYRPQHI